MLLYLLNIAQTVNIDNN